MNMQKQKNSENEDIVNTKGDITYWVFIKPQYHLRKLLDRDFSSLEKYLRDAIAERYYNSDLEDAKNNWDPMNLNNRVQLLYRIDFEAKYQNIENLLSDKAYKHYKLNDNGISEDQWMNSNEASRKNILKEIFVGQ